MYYYKKMNLKHIAITALLLTVSMPTAALAARSELTISSNSGINTQVESGQNRIIGEYEFKAKNGDIVLNRLDVMVRGARRGAAAVTVTGAIGKQCDTVSCVPVVLEVSRYVGRNTKRASFDLEKNQIIPAGSTLTLNIVADVTKPSHERATIQSRITTVKTEGRDRVRKVRAYSPQISVHKATMRSNASQPFAGQATVLAGDLNGDGRVLMNEVLQSMDVMLAGNRNTTEGMIVDADLDYTLTQDDIELIMQNFLHPQYCVRAPITGNERVVLTADFDKNSFVTLSEILQAFDFIIGVVDPTTKEAMIADAYNDKHINGLTLDDADRLFENFLNVGPLSCTVLPE